MLTFDILKNQGVDESQYAEFVASLEAITPRAASLANIQAGLEQLGYIIQLQEAERSIMVFLSTADGEHVMPLASIVLAQLALQLY